MKIEPRYPNGEEVVFKLSLKSRKILEHYSDYTGLTPAQVIEETLPNLLYDEDFLEYVENKRSNKTMKRDLGLIDD